ncbi:MAG: hypothetical protein WA655_21065 [Candidatus Korobacteraceae bacterium]
MRHQLLVLQRRNQKPRLQLSSFDRVLWVWLSRIWPDWKSALRIVKPETVIAWHRKGFRLYWRWKSRPRHGRPPVTTEVRDLSAIQISKKCKSPSNQLSVTVYNVFDPPSPAPANILEIDFQNPALPSEDDSSWAESGGNEFPLAAPIEWMQALDHAQDYEKENLVGCTGWVVAPDNSGADAPFDHPFGFDWEFQAALDDDANGYQALLSPANINPQESGIGQLLANEQGLPMRRGLPGIEWDCNLIPQSFKARVRHGDRVAAFGRWILDTGHSFLKFWRTEIHPPLLLVGASIEKNARAPESTRSGLHVAALSFGAALCGRSGQRISGLGRRRRAVPVAPRE